MLARLIHFSPTQRLLLLVLTALLVGAGVLAFSGLPIDAFPDVSTTQVKIILKAPGMTPERWNPPRRPRRAGDAGYPKPAAAALDIEVCAH